jgi:hypothetical protein
MRSFLTFALFATLASSTVVYSQSLAEHAAAAAGATIGTAAGKPVSNALTNIFGQVDQVTATAAGGKATATTSKAGVVGDKGDVKPFNPQEGEPFPKGYEAGAGAPASAPAPLTVSRPVARPRPAAVARTAPRYYTPPVVEEPLKDVTPEQLSSIKIGATAKDLQTALGVPESHVTVPADGHLLESCQYWAQGKQVGTVRLDNGQVVKVEIRNQ